MPKLATEVDKLIDEVAQLHFELMELRHKQSKVALAERRLRYLDYQKRYYREKIATDSQALRKRRARCRQDKIPQQEEPVEATQAAKCTREDEFFVKF
jgi:hypothetical protein